jgi:hypothetical protein
MTSAVAGMVMTSMQALTLLLEHSKQSLYLLTRGRDKHTLTSPHLTSPYLTSPHLTLPASYLRWQGNDIDTTRHLLLGATLQTYNLGFGDAV